MEAVNNAMWATLSRVAEMKTTFASSLEIFYHPENISADDLLMYYVNMLSVVTFLAIVCYHFITATEKDAEL